MADYRDSRGNHVRLGAEVGRGGEGAVFRVQGNRGQVAKVWHDPTPRAGEKIAVMVRQRPAVAATDTRSGGVFGVGRPSAHLPFAWPDDVLYDESDRIVGFLMPYVDLSQFRESQAFFNPAARRRTEQELGTSFGDIHLLQMARNLAEAVRQIHEAGHVIGDVNEKNVLINARSEVIIVDIDAIQISDPNSGRLYRCTVGRDDYTPPRLQEVRFSEIDRQPNDDLFGLGVLIFKLIMGGYHPYMSRIAPDDEDAVTELSAKIRNGYFPYNEDNTVPDDYKQPVAQYQENWDNLRQEIKHLFCEAFDPFLLRTGTGRPAPEDWIRALDRAIELQQQQGTQRPRVNLRRRPRNRGQPSGQTTTGTPTLSRTVRLAMAAGVVGVLAVVASCAFLGGLVPVLGSIGGGSSAPPAVPTSIPVAAVVEATATPHIQATIDDAVLAAIPTDTPTPEPTATPVPIPTATPDVAPTVAPPADPPTLSLSETLAFANDVINIMGGGFGSGSTIPVANFTINGAPLTVQGDNVHDGLVQIDGDGRFSVEARLWPVAPIEGDASGGTYTITVTGADGVEVDSDITIPGPTLTVLPEFPSPRDFIAISGENWPKSALGQDFVLDVSVGGKTYVVPIDDSGRFLLEVRLRADIALGVEHPVEAILRGYSQRVKVAATFSTPTPSIILSPAVATPGDTITVELQNMPLYSLVDEISISGINILGDRELATDRWGNASIGDLVVPVIDPGAHVVLVTVGSTPAFADLSVLPVPPTPTPAPYPDPVLLEQRGSLPSDLARVRGVGQYVSGCFVGDQPRQENWFYLADRPSATLENARNPILLDYQHSVPKGGLRELLPGKCYYVGPVFYRDALAERRCPGSVYDAAACGGDEISQTFDIFVTERPLHEITEPPSFD